MKDNREKTSGYTSEYELEGRIPLGKAILFGMQHVLAMFVGNLTPILVVGGACGLRNLRGRSRKRGNGQGAFRLCHL